MTILIGHVLLYCLFYTCRCLFRWYQVITFSEIFQVSNQNCQSLFQVYLHISSIQALVQSFNHWFQNNFEKSGR